jgi:hypothetical protein
MVNKVWLIATAPLTVEGRTYDTGDRFALPAVKSGALLVKRQAVLAPDTRMNNTPVAITVTPPRRRGRPRKSDTTAPSYRRRDLQAEE